VRPREPGDGPVQPAATTPTPTPIPGGPSAVGSGDLSLNPDFDWRMRGTGGAGPAGLDRPISRGRISTMATPVRTVNFLFNPSVLGTQFDIDPTAVIDPTKTDQSAVGTAFVGQGSVNIDLLFDRTYEVWDRGPTYSAAATYGVHIDVLAFYMFCGMIDITTPDVINSRSWESLYPRNQLTYQAAFLHIGSRLKFFGYVQSLSVQYSHWASDMTPIRAAISVNFATQTFGTATGSTDPTTPTPTPTPTTPATPKGPTRYIPGKGFGIPVR
jgi:hypothetical protein